MVSEIKFTTQVANQPILYLISTTNALKFPPVTFTQLSVHHDCGSFVLSAAMYVFSSFLCKNNTYIYEYYLFYRVHCLLEHIYKKINLLGDQTDLQTILSDTSIEYTRTSEFTIPTCFLTSTFTKELRLVRTPEP